MTASSAVRLAWTSETTAIRIGARRSKRSSLCHSGNLRREGFLDVESIQVHHLVPRGDEVAHELLLRVAGRIDFCQRAELGIRSEDQIHAAGGPLDIAFSTTRPPF